jgi:hypothetical protein
MDSGRRRALEDMLERRPPKPLSDGDHLALHYALRCLCPRCRRILNWTEGDSVGVFRADCCGLMFHMRPFSVKISIKDSKPETLIPPARESLFPGPGSEIVLPE